MLQKQSSKSAWAEKWPAPAKLNLMLRIVGQRADGYHLLQTVFQFIDLYDWIVFHPVDDGRVSLANTIPGVPELDDLTVRAANLLKIEAGCRSGVRIEVEKNLPMGGGLGGGSSDAATTLVVCLELVFLADAEFVFFVTIVVIVLLRTSTVCLTLELCDEPINLY